MSPVPAPSQIPEEEWIAKYRAALDSIPVDQSPWAKLRGALVEVFAAVFSKVKSAARNTTGASSPRKEQIGVGVLMPLPNVGKILHEQAGGQHQVSETVLTR